MIDSHCHLADKAFDADLPAVLERAKEAGVDRMITIADSFEEGEKCLQIAAKYDHIFCTVGMHPHVASQWKNGDEERLMTMARSSPKVKAIGEIGLDFHYDFSPRDVQREVFQLQLQIARELNVPAVVHCRSASQAPQNERAVEEIWSIVDDVKPKKLVVHCCTERFEDVERFINAGYHLSFTGIATYPKSEVIRDCIRRTPLERIMIETDAPYLAPESHRGKRNEPAFVAEVLACVAREKGIEVGEAERVLTANTVEFFDLPQ